MDDRDAIADSLRVEKYDDMPEGDTIGGTMTEDLNEDTELTANALRAMAHPLRRKIQCTRPANLDDYYSDSR